MIGLKGVDMVCGDWFLALLNRWMSWEALSEELQAGKLRYFVFCFLADIILFFIFSLVFS